MKGWQGYRRQAAQTALPKSHRHTVRQTEQHRPAQVSLFQGPGQYRHAETEQVLPGRGQPPTQESWAKAPVRWHSRNGE